MCMCVCVGGHGNYCFYSAVLLSCRYDSRVKAMELDERPNEQYSDIGGLDKQIEEVHCDMYSVTCTV